MKPILFFILAAGLILSISACSKREQGAERAKPEEVPLSQPQEEPATVQKEQSPPEPEEKVYEYDALQSIFMKIADDTTVENLWNMVVEYDLKATTQEYNGGKVVFCIAYTEGAARQKYAESGDYLNVTFDILGENFMSNENKLMTAEYVNGSGLTALCFIYGTWYELYADEKSDYSGYYIVDRFSEKDGITIKNSNGYERTIPYFRYDSGEEVIQKMIDGTR